MNGFLLHRIQKQTLNEKLIWVSSCNASSYEIITYCVWQVFIFFRFWYQKTKILKICSMFKFIFTEQNLIQYIFYGLDKYKKLKTVNLLQAERHTTVQTFNVSSVLFQVYSNVKCKIFYFRRSSILFAM